MIRLFSIIALLVLSVSASSAFVESAYADEADAIQVILGITYENIQESFADAGIDPEGDPVFLAAQEEYFEALALLEAGDIATAEASALMAMALFEESAEKIGELLEVQEATLQPPGLGTAVASIFNVQEGITSANNEADELRELIKLNDLDGIDFGDFEESVNLSKTLLAEGVVPDAQVKLILANKIIDDLYVKIGEIIDENSVNEIKERLGDQENLGLTKKDIRELETILEELSTDASSASESSGDVSVENNVSGDESPGKSSAPGQNNVSGDESSGKSSAPGQNKVSGDESSGKSSAPGQNKDNDESGLPSGDDGDDPTDSGFVKAKGSGKIPPGLAKLFGYDDGTGDNANFVGPEGLPSGDGAAEDDPAVIAKNNGFGFGLGNSPDDWFENHYEASIDDTYEMNFDGTTKGHGDGKGKLGSIPQKTGIAPGSLNADIKSGGKKPFCAGKGIGGDPVIILNGPATVLVESGAAYDDQGARACDVGKSEITDLIVFGDVSGIDDTNPSDGVYSITYDVTSPKGAGNSADTVTRTVIVGAINPIFDVVTAGGTFSSNLVPSFTTEIDSSVGNPNLRTYSLGIIQNAIDDGTIESEVVSDISGIADNTFPQNFENSYTVTYTVTDGDGNAVTITETVDVCDGTCGGGGGNTAPSIDSIIADFSVDEGTNGHSLSATASDPDVGDTLTYSWTFSGNGPITVTMFNANTLNPTFDVSTFNGNNPRDITFELSVSDGVNPPVTDTVVVTVNQV